MNKESATTLSIGIAVGALLASVVNAVVPRIRYYKNKPVRAPGGKAWRMSKWVKHNGVLRTQGLVGDFSKIPGSSCAEQTAEALAKLDDILKEAGLARRNLLSVTIFMAHYNSEFQEMNEVYDKWVDQAGLPTRICVQSYMGPGFKIEIQAEAYCCGED